MITVKDYLFLVLHYKLAFVLLTVMLLVGWQGGHLANKNLCHIATQPLGCLQNKLNKNWGDQLTWVHVENSCLNGGCGLLVMCLVQPSFGSGVVRTPARKPPFALLDLSRKSSSSSNSTTVVDTSVTGDGADATFGKPVFLCLLLI